MPPRVGVGVGVLVVEGGHLLLGRRKGSHGSGTWALPGGWLEDGESFAACAARELAEETGLCVAADADLSTLPVVANNVMEGGGVHSVTVFVHVGLGVRADEPDRTLRLPDGRGALLPAVAVMEPNKCHEWRWCPLADPLPTPLFPPLAHLVSTEYWRQAILPLATTHNEEDGHTGADADAPGRDVVAIVNERIEPGSLVSAVVCPSAGGIATFTGTTRDTFEGKPVLRLEYEAYEPMAKSQLLALCATVRKKWSDVRHIAVAHRVGVVPVTEASVEIAISSPHRASALAACAFAIDELKAKVPIWKKEVYGGVEGERGASWKANPEAFESIHTVHG